MSLVHRVRRLAPPVSGTFARRWSSIMALAQCIACTSGGSDVPPELIEAIRDSERRANIGTEVGDVVENLCFEGWRAPRAAGFDPASFETICLYDFADDPEARLLLVNSGAVWCGACRIEYDGTSARPSLEAQLAARESRGFRILGTLFEGLDGNPASEGDAALWASTYDVPFPFALDQSFRMGDFSVAALAPFNMLVDLETMEIVEQLQGDQPAVLYARVDDLLDESR